MSSIRFLQKEKTGGYTWPKKNNIEEVYNSQIFNHVKPTNLSNDGIYSFDEDALMGPFYECLKKLEKVERDSQVRKRLYFDDSLTSLL